MSNARVDGDMTWYKSRHYADWDDIYRKYVGPEPPPAVSYYCCAQFMVHRDRITQYDFEYWTALRDAFLLDERPGKLCGEFEHVWHILFGMEAILSPDLHSKWQMCTPTLTLRLSTDETGRYYTLKHIAENGTITVSNVGV